MPPVPARTALFAGIAEGTRARLAAIERRQTLEPGDVILRQGDPATMLVLVVSGLIKIWRTAEDGTPITLALLGAGEPIGTLHAARDMPISANASAHVRSEIIVWPLEALRQIMADDPALFANVSNYVARYAVRMIERLEEMATVPVEQRIARALYRASGIAPPERGVVVLPLSRQDVADMSGTTLPTVSRTMARWREEGLIGGHRGRIHLLDCPRLRAIAGLQPD